METLSKLNSSNRPEAEEIAGAVASGTVSVAANELALAKELLLADSFVFAKFICGHKELTDKFHRPLSYIVTGCVDQIIELLNHPSLGSYVVEELRKELFRRQIDWNRPEGRARLEELLEFVNIRVYRGAAKSSTGTHAGLTWRITNNPNLTIALMSANDDRAKAFLRQIRETLRSDLYKAFFPERIPSGDLSKLWTEDRLWIGGRTLPHAQWTVEAKGILSNWTGMHFDEFWVDDAVTDETLARLTDVIRQLSGLNGLYMDVPGVKIRRKHIGTVYHERDDNWSLKQIPHALTIEVPIETFDHEPESVHERGKPTNPEWHDEKRILKRFGEVMADPDEGAMSWRRNFWLQPSAGGGKPFPASLLDRATWIKIPVPGDPQKLSIARFKRDPLTNKIAVTEDGKRIVRRLDPMLEMYRVIGADLAFSEFGDNWGISTIGRDNEDYVYQLQTVGGFGWDAFIETLIFMIERWKPRRIGIEKAGAQEWTFRERMENDRRLARYRDIIEFVPHKNESKRFRATNLIADPMKSGRWLRDPNDLPFKRECEDWDPEDKKAVDGRIDSAAIGTVIVKAPKANAGALKGLKARELKRQSLKKQRRLY
jgi:hypothetical protein